MGDCSRMLSGVLIMLSPIAANRTWQMPSLVTTRYIDTDISIVGNIEPLLRCASSGEFMMTEGSGCPMNAGFMALKPDPKLLELSMWFSAKATFSEDKETLYNLHGGWADGSGWPALTPWPGFACGQGFLWTLFYGNGLGYINATSKLVREAWAMHADDIDMYKRPARIVDRCVHCLLLACAYDVHNHLEPINKPRHHCLSLSSSVSHPLICLHISGVFLQRLKLNPGACTTTSGRRRTTVQASVPLISNAATSSTSTKGMPARRRTR
jgi:hypothetical protein